MLSPTPCDRGGSELSELSIQVPSLVCTAFEAGKAYILKNCLAIRNNSHIVDLATLHETISAKLTAGDHKLFGKQALLFLETGEKSWLDMFKVIGEVHLALEVIRSLETAPL